MKKILILILFATSSFAQNAEQLKISNTLEQQRLAWNKGDLHGYMQAYWNSDSLVFIGKSGPQYGWQKTFDNYKRSYPDKSAMGELFFKILSVEIINDKEAFVMGEWLLKREKDEPKGYFTLRLRKINSEWKIISDHSS